MLAKKIISLIAIALLAAVAHAAKAKTVVARLPDTDEDGCYLISTAGELYGFAELVNGSFAILPGVYPQDSMACAKLINDIVVNENVFRKDGSLNVSDTAKFAKWYVIENFQGSFDGQGYTISGLFANSTMVPHMGLFSSVGSADESQRRDVSIKNVRLVDTYFEGNRNVGGFVGLVEYNTRLTIDRCSFAGGVKGGWHVGGFVGWDYSGVSISSSYNEASVVGGNYAGGFAGLVVGENLSIVNSYNLGSVSGDDFVGGVVSIAPKMRLINVFNLGQVSAFGTVAQHAGPVAGSAAKYNIDRSLIDNVFSLAPAVDSVGASMTEEEFANGIVVTLMRDYDYDGVDGSAWGQDIGSDPYPVLSGVVSGEVSLPTITITLDTGSGEPCTREILSGYEFRIPEVKRENYKLMAWYGSEDFSLGPITHVPATQATDVKYWGYYERTYNVTLETNGGRIDSLGVDSYAHTVGAKLPRAVSRKGYVFAGWYAAEDFSGNAVDSVTATDEGDKVFYAKWLEVQIPERNADDCYVISNAGELYGFAAIVNGTAEIMRNIKACAVLSQDIVVNENVLDEDGNLNGARVPGFMLWTPIDNFAGTFDGQMHTVSGLYFDDPKNKLDRTDVGFFGSMGGSEDVPAVIKNMGLVDSYFASDARNVGGVVGRILRYAGDWASYYSEVKNVYSTSTLKTSDSTYSLGGIVGNVDLSGRLLIENCYNRGAVRGYRNFISGLVGYAGYSGKVVMRNCYNASEISYVVSSSGISQLIAYTIQNDYAAISNSFYLDSSKWEIGGTRVAMERFADGTVAEMLHEGKNGSVWGQDVGIDSFPLFSGEIKNSAAVKYNVTFYTFDGDTATFFDHYWAGVRAKLPHAQREGFWFDGWYDNAMLGGNFISYITESDTGELHFYAMWELIIWSVYVKVNNSEWGSIEGLNESGDYYYGEECSIKAVPKEGYRFSYWSDDEKNTDPERSFVVKETVRLTAYFEKVESSSSAESSSSVVSSSSEESSSSSSSSSAKSSSSSAKSSSSSAKSSSSSVKSSSSSVNSSSSAKSSSSVASSSSAVSSSSAKSSSSKTPRSSSSCKNCINALPEVASVPSFQVTASGRNILVAGASAGNEYALLDMQGRIICRGVLESADTVIPVGRSGNYLVRISNRVQPVSVK